MARQKLVGWILIVLSCAYLVYFLKARLFVPGPYVSRHEWLQVAGSALCLMLGVVNVRLAARADTQRQARLSNRLER